MTFLTELSRLREAATKKDYEAAEIYRKLWKEYLINHAEAIEELVRAAENLRDVKGRHHTEIATVRLFDTLEKLNRSE